MNNFTKPALILSKIMEVGHWVATGLMAAAAILSVAAPHLLKFVMDVESLQADPEVTVYGFSAQLASGGQIDYTALLLYAIGATAIFVLMALTFRNLHGIIKASETASPFSTDNIQRLTWIGRFCFMVPLVGFVMCIVMRLVIGVDVVQVSMDHSGLIMGAIVLCLVQYFIRGAELQKLADETL